MQIVIDNLSLFIDKYVSSCRGHQSPDLYMCLTFEENTVDTEGPISRGVSPDGEPCVANGLLISNWSFVDDLNGISYLWRKKEASSVNTGEYYSANPHDTYVGVVAMVRSQLTDKFDEHSLTEIDQMIPEVYSGMVGDAYSPALCANIVSSDNEVSTSYLFTPFMETGDAIGGVEHD